jgi:hypothetical protein
MDVSKLNKIYGSDVTYSQAQSICRDILLQEIEKYEFIHYPAKDVICNMVNHMHFPLEYQTMIVKQTHKRNLYEKLAYGLIAVGLLGSIVLLILKYSSDVLSILSGLFIGISAFVYRASFQNEFKQETKIVTPLETIKSSIEEIYLNLIRLDILPKENVSFPKDILIWFQKQYAWACRQQECVALKNDIEFLLRDYGYDFCLYSLEVDEYFDASNANVEKEITTVYALRHIKNNSIVLRGKVVFPME